MSDDSQTGIDNISIGHSATEVSNAFVLIHGTFARRAPWTRPGSKLGRALSTAYADGSIVLRFNWSGRNSHAARLKAAGELRSYLTSLRNQYPNARIRLLAHSHGGNVVFYALKDATVAATIAAVVNFATPYIRPKPRPLERYIRFHLMIAPFFLWWLSFYVVALSVELGSYLFGFSQDPFDISYSWIPLLGTSILFTIGATVLLRRAVLTKLVPFLARRMESTVASIKAECPSTVPVLSNRITADEPAWALRLVSTLARLPYEIWSPPTTLLGTAAIVILSAWATASFSTGNLPDGPGPMTLGDAMGVGIVVGVLMLMMSAAASFILTVIWQPIAVAWSLLFQAHALGFGGMGIYLNWLVAMRAVVTLEDAPQLTQVLYRRHFALRLRHSELYEDDQVIADTIKWFRGLDRLNI